MYGSLPTAHRPPQNQRLSSEVVGNNNLFVTMYGGLPTDHRPPQNQRLSSAQSADFRLRLLEAPAYTAEPIKKNGFTSKLASALFLLTPVHSYFTT